MARSQYTFKKRQKELVRLKKKEEKRQRKLEKKSAETDGSNDPENAVPQNKADEIKIDETETE